MKKIRNYWPALCFVTLLAGCQTVPLTATVGSSFTASSPDKARLRITAFPIPKDEPGTKLLHFLVGGPGLGQPIGASIYDVTDEIRYIGNLVLDVVTFSRNPVSWLEYQPPAGRRLLMLVEAPPQNAIALTGGGPLRQVDFVEVEAKPGQVKFIALTRQGFLTKPYFGEVDISEADRNACEALTNASESTREAWNTRLKHIETYMATRGIDSYTRDFRLFCHILSAPRRIEAPTPEAMKQYVGIKAEIRAAYESGYPQWKAENPKKKPPYDLMKNYRPIEPYTP